MNKSKPSPNHLLPLTFGLLLFGCFLSRFPHHFHYREQFQMFLFTTDYFTDVCSTPGGFCNYLGRFLTQFYVYAWLGALIVGATLLAMRQLVYSITQKCGRERSGEWLSFLPALGYAFLLCDENTHIGGAIALCIALLLARAMMNIERKSLRRFAVPAAVPLAYMLIGGAICMSVLLWLMHEYKQKGRRKVEFAITTLASLAVAVITPFAAKSIWMQYPVERLWAGVDYVHFLNYNPWDVIYICILTLIIVGLAPRLPGFGKLSHIASTLIGTAALAALSLAVMIGIAAPQHASKEEIMAYDYHCRMRNWDKIISMANRKSPTTPMTVCCLNLALYHKGRLADDMFRYFQNGPDGLLPAFRRDFMIPTVGGEAYYHLGFINTARRFAFEAMEALPDFQKSARSIKRLAETNMIAGHYERAAKYLHLLEHTLFYRKWAREAKPYLYSDSLVNTHPEWGSLRRFHTRQDFLFSEAEKDMMLGICFTQQPGNRMAYEYLMAYALLTKDMKKFRLYYDLHKDFSIDTIPKAWQEALVYIWGLTGAAPENIPMPVSKEVKLAVKAYANIYTTVKAPEPLLRKDFAKTYWYYLHFREYNRAKPEQNYQY
ncbi:MAG: DUF6057 family protein [Tannerellaceae bacterium]|jgi:hypothetical protein|nr:DUF6057 family protein [Tannerellaceae bacterium]